MKPILVPKTASLKKDSEKLCACNKKTMTLTYKTGLLIWNKEIGDFVHKDDIVCAGEVEKSTLEFVAPCDGFIVEKCINDNEEFKYGDILGYIEEKNNKFSV